MSERGLTGGSDAGDVPSVVRHEEELVVDTRPIEYGEVRARKRVESERYDDVVDREVEHADELDRVPANEADSGEIETLPDGSVSIPVFEERLVVRKEIVVRERVILRKRTVTEHERVEAELRKERVEIETSGEDVLDREVGPRAGNDA